LIRGCGYQARHIAAVTFTNKAAREMKERVGQTLGRKEARGQVGKHFHHLRQRIYRRIPVFGKNSADLAAYR
jgi:ATP-dependent DNA helicase Rep